MMNTNPTRSATVNSDKFPDALCPENNFQIHENTSNFHIMEYYFLCPALCRIFIKSTKLLMFH